MRDTNPILACVADQTRYDKDWPEDDLDGVDLLEVRVRLGKMLEEVEKRS